jgi:hypothetical protein
MGKDSTWGFPGYLTEAEKEMLAALRQRVEAELPKKEYLARDATLLRFCRARNFHPSKTWDMLKEDVEWREQFEGYVYIRSRDFGGAYAMHEEGAVHLGGKSKDNRPVLLVQASHYWPKLITDNIQIVYFFTFYVDAVCRMAEQAGHDTFFAIADLKGFSWENFSFSQIKIAISLLQNHYPERLGMIYVINAPFVFTAAWRMIQPLLDERTRNKIDILGSDITKVYDNIEPSQLEPPFGTHEKFPIPDEIVQVAIDNERFLLPDGGVAVAVAVPPVAPVATTTSLASPPTAVASSSPARTKKKSVRKLLRKMLFITEKRAAAQSLGLDPDELDDGPKKLLTSSSRNMLGKKTADAMPPLKRAATDEDDSGALRDEDAEELEKELLELREAHDKLLNKLTKVEAELGGKLAVVQNQVFATVAALIVLVGLFVLALFNGEARRGEL